MFCPRLFKKNICNLSVQTNVQNALKRLDEVQEMFEKRRISLKRLSAKQTRPVQPVAPRPESSPKRTPPKTPRPTGQGKHITLFRNIFAMQHLLTHCLTTNGTFTWWNL